MRWQLPLLLRPTIAALEDRTDSDSPRIRSANDKPQDMPSIV